MNVNARITATVLFAAGAAALLTGCDPEAAGQAAPTATETVTAGDEPAEQPGETAAPAEPADGGPARCTADDVSPELAEGAFSPEMWSTAVVLTNVSGAECRIEGVGDITFIAPSGDPYDIAQETAGGDGPVDLVIIGPDEQASMYVNYPSPESGIREDCSGPISAQVTLPSDDRPLEVEPPAAMEEMPALCDGPISVSPFTRGGFE
ncbi:MAG: DUF4232 domain-containing protein [Actinophytocola sp.]|uniref:DUF4232 domain-containing protein n=1 Tax=Actinophytocola sp. TaxID=1872138 RepID=UPI003D6AC557